jgi:hypothetical protein
MLGKVNQAEQAIQKWTQEFRSFGSTAGSQAWALHAADGYAMLGKIEQATQEGWRATSGENTHLHMERYTGPFARWTARSSVHTGRISDGHKKLDALVANLESYDALDKAEILNAKAWLSAKTGMVPYQLLASMRSYLEALPSAVADQLRCMGMLHFWNETN